MKNGERRALSATQLQELILQSLEHERGGVKVYEAALQCALEKDLHEEWDKYLGQTRRHVAALENVCAAFGLDAEAETPGRNIVRMLGQSLVDAMRTAGENGDPKAAQLVACECVVLAETKDHLDWELLAKCAQKAREDRDAKLDPAALQALEEAVAEVEDQEDEHLYHTKGWCRELWIQSLGMQAVLPPLEEQRDVKTAIGAARAEQASEKSR